MDKLLPFPLNKDKVNELLKVIDAEQLSDEQRAAIRRDEALNLMFHSTQRTRMLAPFIGLSDENIIQSSILVALRLGYALGVDATEAAKMNEVFKA